MLVNRSTPFFVALLLLVMSQAGAQIPQKNPVVDAARNIGIVGLSKEKTPDKSPTAFKPSNTRLYIPTFLKEMFEEKAQREAMEPVILKLTENFEKVAKQGGFSNDASAAFAFATSILYSVAKESELDDQAFVTLTERIRASLNTATVRDATDAQKQVAYEWALCSASYVLGLSAVEESDEAKKNTKLLARAQLIALTGADTDRISLKGTEVSIAKAPNAPNAEPKVETGALAPGFTFTLPAQWQKEKVWHAQRSVDGTATTSALVRFLPPVAMNAPFSDILREQWKKYVPAEFAEKASNMIFRRYLGDGLVAHFIFGRGPEKGQTNDSFFTIYLIDCGKYWQPVVVAQTYEDNVSMGVSMSTGFSFNRSADMAEKMLATFRCPAAKGHKIVDASALVGDYSYGNSSTAQWENIYTGASLMTFVSYGGTLNLKGDASFTYTFTSANGSTGNTKFGSAKGKGKWTVEGDILTLKFSEYDQGNDYKVQERKYRIAGVIQFSNGEKVSVFRSAVDTVVNPMTVADRSDYFVTKAK